MVKCEYCGSKDVQWRCTNNETKDMKYKCLECEKIFILPVEKTTALNNEDVINLKTEIDSILGKARRDGGRMLAKRKMLERPSEERYLYKTRHNTRAIYKRLNNKTKYFGTYKKKDAYKIRDRLVQANWDMNQLDDIKKEVLG